MVSLFKKLFYQGSSLDVIPLSRLLLFKDLVNIQPEKKSSEHDEINELW